MASAAATCRVLPNPAAKSGGCDEFVLNARVEFYACMQLLAERARFLTGADYAAIALREGERYVYRAAAGSNAPEIGSLADLPDTPADSNEASFLGKTLLVSVTDDSKTSGFFKLVSEKLEFSDHDLHTVGRLAEMVSTAIGQMHAAEQSLELIYSAAKTASPILWHAPDQKQASAPDKSASGAPNVSLGVRNCQSCGFPVSNGRSVCFDCEQRTGTAPLSSALFRAEEKQSWIKAHGYTIATLLVSVLAAALIYWLR